VVSNDIEKRLSRLEEIVAGIVIAYARNTEKKTPNTQKK